MKKIHGWVAKRSGASITIKGKDADGGDVVIKTSTIEAGRRGAVGGAWPTAQAEDGQFYQLL